jgi:hypothetical protein
MSYDSDQIRGLERVYDLRGSLAIAAVNMSLGGGGYTSQASCDSANRTRKTIIDTLRTAGIATIVASGNEGFVNALSAPACISSAISVGSTTDGSFDATPADEVSEFTNSAPFLTLLAPGHWITSSVPGGGFNAFAGTSMAAPHVAGAWALLRSRSPSASVVDVLGALTSTGTGVFDPGNGQTKPRINVQAALSSVTACSYSVTPAFADIAADGGSRTVTVTTQPDCSWTAISNASFIVVTGGSSGSGSGTVTYAVNGNLSPQSRTGTLTVAGTVVTVTQAAATARMPDFNRDGRIDLLWYHQTDGRVAAWLMNGTTMVQSASVGFTQVADVNWKPVGTGDVDGDGHTDVVWQNIADGRVSTWFLSGLAVRSGDVFAQVADLQWRIRAVGDFDADGRADLFWHHQGNGSLAVWRMAGVTIVEARLLDAPPVTDANWLLVGTADMDGSGSRDLVWRHEGDGRIAVWLMNGAAFSSATGTTPAQVPDTSWKIRGVGDINNDGRADLLWQHASDGRVAAWLMNGLTQVSGVALTPSQVADPNWHIVGPR